MDITPSRAVCVFSLSVLFFMTPSIQADIIYSQTVRNTYVGSDSTRVPVEYVADNFALSSQASVAGINFWGGYGPSGAATTDNFTLRFFNNGSSAPGTVITSMSIVPTRSLSGNNFLGVPEYQYTATFTPTIFAAGQTYWVSIVNDTTASSDSWGWSGTPTVGDGSRFSPSSPTTGPWNTLPGNTAYELTGTAVPEPTSLLLLSLTFVFVFCRWKLTRMRTQTESIGT